MVQTKASCPCEALPDMPAFVVLGLDAPVVMVLLETVGVGDANVVVELPGPTKKFPAMGLLRSTA
jgi:hypothetical protein